MLKKRALAIVFSAVLSLTTAVPAFAHHKPGHHPPGHNRGGNTQTQTQQQTQTQEQHQCILVLGLLQPATC